jgi:hypothetical protein
MQPKTIKSKINDCGTAPGNPIIREDIARDRDKNFKVSMMSSRNISETKSNFAIPFLMSQDIFHSNER